MEKPWTRIEKSYTRIEKWHALLEKSFPQGKMRIDLAGLGNL